VKFNYKKNMTQKTKNKQTKENTKQHAMLIWAAQSHSACRAVPFWLLFSLREHQGALRARNPEIGILTEMSTRVFRIYHYIHTPGFLEFLEKVVSKALST
jgi:hypothetical protein